MMVRYEWCAEQMDGEDIIDSRRSEKLSELWPIDDDENLVLIRDTGNDVSGLKDRMWAYVEYNMLPAEFTYCDGETNGTRVSKKFHRELARVSTSGVI